MTTECKACCGNVWPGKYCYLCGQLGPAGEGQAMFDAYQEYKAKKKNRGSPEHPCEECGQTDKGHFVERGFQRCNACGFPGQ